MESTAPIVQAMNYATEYLREATDRAHRAAELFGCDSTEWRAAMSEVRRAEQLRDYARQTYLAAIAGSRQAA